MKAGLPVPKPIAARVQKGKIWDLLPSGYFDRKKLKNAQDLSLLLQATPLPKEIWTQIGKINSSMHDQQVCHTD